MKTMLQGRLQPQGAIPAARSLVLLAGVLGLAAAAAPSFVVGAVREPPLHWTRLGAGQTSAAKPSSPNRMNPQTPPPPPKVNPKISPPPANAIKNTSSPRLPAKSAAGAPARGAGVEPPKRVAPGTAPPAGGPIKQTSVTRPLPISKGKIQTPLPPSKPVQSPAPATAGGTPGEGPSQEPGTKTAKTAPLSNLPIAAGRRDPFKVWAAPNSVARAGSESGRLPAGTRGLVISGLRLEGIVRGDSPSDLIAVVTNSTKRAYFLRVKDAVHNGVVSKITPEAIYFNENMLDSQGRAATHEVEITLGLAPGEGR